MLENIEQSEDLKKLSIKEKETLCEEIRSFLLEKVSKTGGHLASNLGVVELTIALHSIFDFNKDRVIWDVGHQTYIHKMLTGRKEQFDTLRQLNGLSGFPKTSENEKDCFDTGHSSTSISVGLGIAKARDILKEDFNVVCVIGDGALTGGMAQEALNDAGNSKSKITVILNDNEMSISKNVGGMCNFLGRLRTKKIYTKVNINTKKFVTKIPAIGKGMYGAVHKFKRGVKQLLISNMFFEDIGFTYLGPIDGHNIEHLEELLRRSKEIDGPVLIHIITKKGKGYKIAEENPAKFHGISPFDVESGKLKKEPSKDYSKVFGNKIVKLAKENKKIVTVTAAMKDGTGLTQFADKFPERFFDVGIAEQHAVGFCAGLAKQGLKPVFAVYSSFLQRAYDQIIHDVCIQKLPVVLCLDRAGIVGADGETHQGIFDLSYLSHIPNMVTMAPKNFEELEKMLEFSINAQYPIAIRYPRGSESSTEVGDCKEISLGKSEIISQGKDITILAIGKMVATAKEVAKELKEKYDISAEVINSRFLNPLDEETIIESLNKTKRLITIEDNIINGGFGANILELLNKNNIDNIKIKVIGYPNCFIKHGKVEELEKIYGLDKDSILNKCIEMLKLN